MTEPDPSLEEERRFEGKADWSYVHSLSTRIGELEKWQAAEIAISAIRRWAFPVILSVVGSLATVVTLVNKFGK